MGDVRTDLPRVAAVWCIPVTTSLGCKDGCNYTDSYSPDGRSSIACADYRTNPTLFVFNDIIQNLPNGLGVLKSDHDLYNDPVTRPFLEGFAKDQARFFRVFASAMQKLSLLNVQTGRKGEIRRMCDQIN
ncbi:hypothetical protein VIGAN_03050900 [Vigna angularis var. angularis]|uniref:peroxidase n=1 Tax=Vigna angularis var. angularis TaxID=157739 RepID=A0A0S3RJV7_PHAAN|nr:hypothetical protein VIGAN_03050900 [Vigna angularis var. angularis]